jgi:hypothetical protein
MKVVLEGRSHPDSLLYYLYAPFYLFLPSFFLSLPILYLSLKRFRSSDAVAYCITWFLVALAILTLTGNKQEQYSLIMLWPFAALVGWFLDELFAGTLASRVAELAASVGFYSFTIIVAGGMIGYYTAKKGWGYGPFELPPFFIVAAALAVIIASMYFWRKRPKVAVWLVLLYSLAAFVPVNTLLKFEKFEVESSYTFCEELARVLPENAPLYLYRHRNPCLIFQLQKVLPVLRDPDDLLEVLGEKGMIFVIYEEAEMPLLPSFQEATLVREELFREKMLTLSRLTMKDGGFSGAGIGEPSAASHGEAD